MAEKLVLFENCPCGHYCAEVFVDGDARTKRLDFREIEGKPPEPPVKPEDGEENIVLNTLLG